MSKKELSLEQISKRMNRTLVAGLASFMFLVTGVNIVGVQADMPMPKKSLFVDTYNSIEKDIDYFNLIKQSIDKLEFKSKEFKDYYLSQVEFELYANKNKLSAIESIPEVIDYKTNFKNQHSKQMKNMCLGGAFAVLGVLGLLGSLRSYISNFEQRRLYKLINGINKKIK